MYNWWTSSLFYLGLTNTAILRLYHHNINHIMSTVEQISSPMRSCQVIRLWSVSVQIFDTIFVFDFDINFDLTLKFEFDLNLQSKLLPK